jgi:hypothetical protein
MQYKQWRVLYNYFPLFTKLKAACLVVLLIGQITRGPYSGLSNMIQGVEGDNKCGGATSCGGCSGGGSGGIPSWVRNRIGNTVEAV